MCYLDDIFVYLRARANDAIPRGRPQKHEDKPEAATKAENSCLGQHELSAAAQRLPASCSPSGWTRSAAMMNCASADGCATGRAPSARRWRCVPAKLLAQALERPHSSLELVDPKVLRVCADPHNMPFSTDKGEGFENKLAELFADKLGKGLAYTWYPQATGFVRNTLAAHKCDVIMGVPQGDDLVQVTNPYYRTAYALVFKPGNDLDGVDTLERSRASRANASASWPGRRPATTWRPTA